LSAGMGGLKLSVLENKLMTNGSHLQGKHLLELCVVTTNQTLVAGC